MNEGWVCPKCGGVFAPWVEQCGNCVPRSFPVPTDKYEYIPWPDEIRIPSTGDPPSPPTHVDCSG